MSRTRGALAVVAIGLAITIASALGTSEVHHAPDSYVGNARLHGLPLPYYFSTLPGGDETLMALQVYCVYSLRCEDYNGADAGEAPFMHLPFLCDVVAWTALAGMALLALRLAGRSVRHRRRTRPDGP